MQLSALFLSRSGQEVIIPLRHRGQKGILMSMYGTFYHDVTKLVSGRSSQGNRFPEVADLFGPSLESSPPRLSAQDRLLSEFVWIVNNNPHDSCWEWISIISGDSSVCEVLIPGHRCATSWQSVEVSCSWSDVPPWYVVASAFWFALSCLISVIGLSALRLLSRKALRDKQMVRHYCLLVLECLTLLEWIIRLIEYCWQTYNLTNLYELVYKFTGFRHTYVHKSIHLNLWVDFCVYDGFDRAIKSATLRLLETERSKLLLF